MTDHSRSLTPAGLTEPPKGWDDYPEGGDPPGIARGFGYAPGANTRAALRDLVDARKLNLPPELARALEADAARVLGSFTRWQPEPGGSSGKHPE